MPLEVRSVRETLEIAKKNKYFRSWPRHRGRNRVEPVAQPDFRPSFKLVPGEKIFTVGSCFAHNIEKYLIELGFNLSVADLIRDPIIQNERYKEAILYTYTPQSMLNQFQWALEPERSPFPDSHGYLELAADRWIDPYLANTSEESLEYVRARRAVVTEHFKSIRDCRVVIITPGLIEAWWDRKTGYYLNIAPLQFIQREPDRFEFHVNTYDEVVQAFTETYDLLRRHMRSDFRILFTVSPAPLIATFRDMDIMVANTYSKSVLRAAAEVFCSSHDNVDYFPSYESVMVSERRLAWEDDLIHPTDGIVKANVYRMIERYVDSPDEAVLSKLQANLEALEDFEAGRSLDGALNELAACETRIRKLEALLESQEEILRAKEAQLQRSQETSAHYLRQILERDGILEPQAVRTGD